MAGTDLYWGHGEAALRELAEALCIPVFLNGLARGCVAADHELCFSRTRSRALREADVALVIGVPMDFRLGFGGAFGEETEIVAIDVAEPERRHPREPAVELYGVAERDPRRPASGGERARRGDRRGTPEPSRGLRSCARPRASCARASGRSCRTRGRRCIRCACMPSWRRCWIATRS